MQIGYHPARVRELLARTAATIDDLAAIGCSDPAAADAQRAIRLTRRNLEDHWMPLLRDIASSSAMTTWTRSRLVAGAPPSTPHDRLRAEWAHNASWLTLDHNETTTWSDRRLIGAVTAHDTAWRLGPDGGYVDPFTAADDLFVDAMHELAFRVAADPDFAALLLATAGDTATLGAMVVRGPFAPSFVAEVARRMLAPDAGLGLLADRRAQHDAITSNVLDRLRANPDLALDLLGDADVRVGLVWRTGLDTVSVREFVGSGLHLAVLSDPLLLQSSLDALVAFVPLADRTTFPAGVAQGIGAAVATHMTHLGPLLDAGTSAFPDVAGNGALDVDGVAVSYTDLQSLYGRVVRDPDAQLLVEIALADYLAQRLDAVPASIARSADSAHPQPLGDVIRSRIEPAVKALTLVFGAAAAFEQQRVDALHAQAQRRFDGRAGAAITLLGVLPVGSPITTVLDVANKLAPGSVADDVVPDNDVLANLDGVVAREALRLVVADEALRAAAGLDVVDDATWERLRAAADDPTIDFTNRGTLMHELAIEGPDVVLVETFFGRATGTVDATPG